MASDPLQSRADMLVESASVYAIPLYTTLGKEFPRLLRVDPKHWDVIATIAAVFIAVTRLNGMKLGAREDALLKRVGDDLNKWNAQNAMSAFHDCKSFFDRTYDALGATRSDPKFIASDSLGSWITLNTLGKPSGTDEELRFIRVAGGMVTSAFDNWWTLKR